MITASDLIAVETMAAKEDLWTPAALFLPDWGAGITVRTSWPTQVASVQSAREVRSNLAPKPSRSVDMTVAAMDQRELALLRSTLQRMTLARSVVPLYCDQTPLTAATAVTTTGLACETQGRRFFVGGRVVIWPDSARTMTEDFEVGVIAAVTEDGITLVAGAAATWPVGSLVAPVMEGDLVGAIEGAYRTDALMTAQLTFRETVGAMTLEALVTPGEVPEGIATYGGVPVFGGVHLPADWSMDATGGAQRLYETSQAGMGGMATYTETHGGRFAVTQAQGLLQMDRSQAAALMGFFDGRGGRQKPFVAANLTSDFVLAGTIGEGSTSVELQAQAPLKDWEWRTQMVLRFSNGELLLRTIGSVERAEGVDTITFADNPLPAREGGYGGVQLAAGFVARFASDELEENWITPGILRVRLPQVEVPDELVFSAEEETGEAILTAGGRTLAHLPSTPVAGGLRATVANPASLEPTVFPLIVEVEFSDGEICQFHDNISYMESAQGDGDGDLYLPANPTGTGYPHGTPDAYAAVWGGAGPDGFGNLQPYQFNPYVGAPFGNGGGWAPDAGFYAIIYVSLDGTRWCYLTSNRNARGAFSTNPSLWTAREHPTRGPGNLTAVRITILVSVP